MIFQHTIDKVLSGEKTQTRRLVKPGDELSYWADLPAVFNGSDPENETWGRMRWRVGQVLSVQPGRTQKGIAKIHILQIRKEDVRQISAIDAKAEGFETWMMFLDTWLMLHDKSMLKKWEHWIKRLEDRPADRYQAWALTFKLVKP